MGCFDVNSIHSFPPSAKILFKLFDGSLMEIVSLTSKIINIHKNKYVPTIYYPISEEQLVSLFSGIKKIRIEFSNGDSTTADLKVFPTSQRNTVQVVSLSKPVVTDYVKITILDYEASVFEDTCLTYVAPN